MGWGWGPGEISPWELRDSGQGEVGCQREEWRFSCRFSPHSRHQSTHCGFQPLPQPAGGYPALRLLPRGHQGRDDLRAGGMLKLGGLLG